MPVNADHATPITLHKPASELSLAASWMTAKSRQVNDKRSWLVADALTIQRLSDYKILLF